ncbi:MAG TPA: hypothetical protein ENI23_11805 [bacterium]|nr:hypothetical protein [bacterium]
MNENRASLQVTVANHCICIGNHAGKWIVDEDYQFCFTVSGNLIEEYRTTMTPEEFEVVNKVVRRAIKNKRILGGGEN